MSGPWDRPSRESEDTWPAEDTDAPAPPAPQQPTDDPWASRDLWPEPSRDASPGWDDWPTQPAQDDYLGEEPPPPALSDPWAESWSDDSSMAPAPPDAWSEPAAERPPFEQYPERVERSSEPQRESEPEPEPGPSMAEAAGSAWEPRDELESVGADADAETPAAVPLEPWSPDADPWAAAMVQGDSEADGADAAPTNQPEEVASEPEPHNTEEEAPSPSEAALPVEEAERPSQPFAGAFSGLGRAARTVLPDWLAEPHAPEPESEPEPEPRPEPEPALAREAPGELADDVSLVDTQPPGGSVPNNTRLEGAPTDEAPDLEDPGRPPESDAAAADTISDPEPEAATDEREPSAPHAPVGRPWWRSVGPWASADTNEAAETETAAAAVEGAAGVPLEDHAAGEPDASTFDGDLGPSQPGESSGPEDDHAERLDPAAQDASLYGERAQAEDPDAVSSAVIPPPAPSERAPDEPTEDLTPAVDEDADEEGSLEPDETPPEAAAPYSHRAAAEPSPDAWPSMDVPTVPEHEPESWPAEVPGGEAEPDMEVDVAPAVDVPPAIDVPPAVEDPPWPAEPTNGWATRTWDADTDTDADEADEAGAPVDKGVAAEAVEPLRWDDPERPAVESTQVLPTSWAAARPDPGVAPRPDGPLDPVGGDIRTRLGTAEPDIDLDEEGEPQPTTAEQAVPWLIGFILLLAGMVIVLLALIFAGDESLGGSGASPSASGQIGLVSESASASPAASRTASPAPTRSAASAAPSVAPTPTPVPLPEYGALEMLYQGRSAALAPIYLLHREFTVEEAPQVLAQDPNLDVRGFAWAPDGTVGVALYSDVLVSVEIGTEKRRLGDGLSAVTFGDDAATVYAVRVTQDGGNDVATVVAIDFAAADTRDIARITYARPDLVAEESLVEAQFADDGGAVRLHWTENDTLRLWAAGAGAWEITPDEGEATEAGVDPPLLWAPDGRSRIILEVAEGQTTLRLLNHGGDTSATSTVSGIVSHLRWSPSGDRVVFTVGRSASGGGILQDLFLWDLQDGVAPTQLTSTGAAFGAEWRGSQARWEAP